MTSIVDVFRVYATSYTRSFSCFDPLSNPGLHLQDSGGMGVNVRIQNGCFNFYYKDIWGLCSEQFRRLQLCSFHRDTTDSRSDSRLPSVAFSGVDGTVPLGSQLAKFSEGILDFTAAETLFAFQSNPLGPLMFGMPKCPAPRTSKAFVLLHFSDKNSLSPLFYDGQRGIGYPCLLCLPVRSKNLPCSCI